MNSTLVCPACGREVAPGHWYGPNNPRCGGRFWTAARRWELMSMIERGWTDERIGRALGVSANAASCARKRYALPSRSRSLLSALDVARRLGISCSKGVVRWIDQGWLKATNGPGRGRHRVHLVREDDLMTFLEDREHWHRWDPTRIPDKALREWATELQAGVWFLSVTEVAARMCVQPNTVSGWIRRGLLPAMRNGNYVVRESDLARFRLPQIGGHRGQREEEVAA